MNNLKDLLQKFRDEPGEMERIRDSILGAGSVSPLQLTESNLIKDIVYTTQEVVAPTRNVIIPFYLPSGTRDISYVLLNIYFPGLQPGDYPFNVSTLYLSPVTKGTIDYKDGAFNLLREEYSLYSGNGATGSSYLWYRPYIRFQIAPLHGFKLSSCDLYWALGDARQVGSGPNTQKPNVLHAINDFELLDKSDWSLTAQVDYGTVNNYNDTIGNTYSKDVKTRVQALIDNLDDYCCFRFKSDEHTDVNNANNYHLAEPQLKCVMQEDTAGEVGVYLDDGGGFGSKIDYFKSNREDIDLGRFVSGTGKKQLKFSCTRARRINVLLRIGFRSR